MQPTTTVAEFLELLASKTSVPVGAQELKSGFPPRPLTLPPDTGAATVGSLGIQAGDNVIVTQRATPEQIGGLATAGASEDEQLARAIAASLGNAFSPPPPAAAASSRPAAAPRAASPSRSHPVQQKQRQQQEQQGAPVLVALPDGSAVTRRIVPSDNSCLFASVGYVTSQNRSQAAQLRRVIVDAVKQDPVEWSEVVLGKDPEEYCRWISDASKWGGQIELRCAGALCVCVVVGGGGGGRQPRRPSTTTTHCAHRLARAQHPVPPLWL